MRKPFILCVLALSTLSLMAGGESGKKSSTAMVKPLHVVLTPAAIQWVNGPASLPPGAKAAVLEGDPSKPGYFAMRLRLPDGYRIAPHWHPKRERVTVISGTLHIGMGDTFDAAKGVEMPPGTYAAMEAKMHHYAWSTGETEIQLATMGPWAINYINPDDDPRKMVKK